MKDKLKFIPEGLFPSTKRDCCTIKDGSISMTPYNPTSDHDHHAKNAGVELSSASYHHILWRKRCIPFDVDKSLAPFTK
jgi:hypothetical protein